MRALLRWLRIECAALTYYERDLPHWHPAGKTVFITWRLFGSLPRFIAGRLKNLRTDPRKQFLVADECLDGGRFGPSWLREPRIARHVRDAFVREHAGASFDAPIGRLAFPGAQRAELGHYDLFAWVVMPNHVHVVLEPRAPLQIITKALKGVSTRDANATLGRAGKRFWQDESFDHWIRNASELERVRSYVERNPVKAELATCAEDWLWSSARR